MVEVIMFSVKNPYLPFRSLELVPFGFKALLRRASAYEALERYRQAYVDYKTVLQIDCNIPAAHDGVNRSFCMNKVPELLSN